MNSDCRYKADRGRQFCIADCPVAPPCGVFRYARIEAPEALPTPDPKAVDVVMLDMNHGWPNMGHDSLAHGVLQVACDLLPLYEKSGIHLRLLSCDVRRNAVVPPHDPERFSVYIGTGGPGHIDPRCNDGVATGSQGIKEDPAWEPRLFELFDAIESDPGAALVAVCHTFGILCRWSGAAQPVLRGPEKGGKSSGVLENVLTPKAQAHPWFSRFAEILPERRRLRIVDNRLFDLLPDANAVGFEPLSYETQSPGGAAGDAVTMLEFARDAAGVMPRMLAVNHHPEIVDRSQQLGILEGKFARGEVSREWYEERRDIMTRTYPDENSDDRLRLTSEFTLLSPLRFHLLRQVRRRAEALGLEPPLHEDSVYELTRQPSLA